MEYPAPLPHVSPLVGKATQWEEVIGSDALDLRVEELKAFIRYLETTTGRVFSYKKFTDIMALENEQEEYFKDPPSPGHDAALSGGLTRSAGGHDEPPMASRHPIGHEP